MFKYITMAADQVAAGHSSGWLGQGDHRKVIEEQYEAGYTYVGWLPVTFGHHGAIKEVDLIFRKSE